MLGQCGVVRREAEASATLDLFPYSSRVPASGRPARRPVVKFTVTPSFVASFPLRRTVPSCQHNMTFKFGSNITLIVQSLLNAHGFTEVSEKSCVFNIFWTWTHPNTAVVRGLKWYQRINHFLRSEEITRKNQLCMNIHRMQQQKGFRHFNIIPQTFILPSEVTRFKGSFRKGQIWIVKPCCSSRGRDIYLINNPDQIRSDESVVVSQYIENPLCIDGFKFDLRLYVLVTSYDPLRVYLYTEGLGRFATEPYVKGENNLSNLYMHLTNYSINKTHPNFVSCQDGGVEDFGNKWSLSAVLKHLKRRGYDIEGLMMSVEDVVIKTIISGEMSIASASRNFQPYRNNCFELFGFDILIDESLKPWVLEVNLSPSLACEGPLDLKIKSNLVADLLSLVGIPLYDPRTPKSDATNTSPIVKTVKPVSYYSEEVQALYHTKEEYKRRGHFVRIFPSEDSWELYGAFLENRTRLNYSIYTHLYSDSCKIKWPPHSATPIATIIARRLRKPDGTGSLPTQGSDAKGLSAIQRVSLYLQQLHEKQGFHAAEEPIVDIPNLELCSLNQYQVRLLLAAYLEKVHGRLLTHSVRDINLRNKDLKKFEENLALVEKFMCYVSSNLMCSLNINIPQKSLPIGTRCRILAKQLMKLIFTYKAETTIMKTKFDLQEAIIGNEGANVTDEAVKDFVTKASESHLESILAGLASKSDKSLILTLSDNLKTTEETGTVKGSENTNILSTDSSIRKSPGASKQKLKSGTKRTQSSIVSGSSSSSRTQGIRRVSIRQVNHTQNRPVSSNQTGMENQQKRQLVSRSLSSPQKKPITASLQNTNQSLQTNHCSLVSSNQTGMEVVGYQQKRQLVSRSLSSPQKKPITASVCKPEATVTEKSFNKAKVRSFSDITKHTKSSKMKVVERIKICPASATCVKSQDCTAARTNSALFDRRSFCSQSVNRFPTRPDEVNVKLKL